MASLSEPEKKLLHTFSELNEDNRDILIGKAKELLKDQLKEQRNHIMNSSSNAIYKTQKAFEGVAEQMGVYNEDDVQALVDEVRYGDNQEEEYKKSRLDAAKRKGPSASNTTDDEENRA